LPKNIQKFAYLLGLAIALHWASQAVAVSIDGIQIETVSDGNRLAFAMNDPIRLNAEMKTADALPNEDLILIHIPAGVEWNAPTRGQGAGLIKEYMFQGQGGGSGNLFIRTNQRVNIKRDGSNTKGYFLDVTSLGGARNPFNPTGPGGFNNPFATTIPGNMGDRPLQVTNIRVGMKDEATRIVLDLTVPMQFTIEQSMAGDKLTIKGQEPVEWRGPKRSFQSEGVVKNYRVMGTGADTYLEVETESGTAVQRSIIEDSNSNAPKYVIDLFPNNLAATSLNALFKNSSNLEGSKNLVAGTGISALPVKSINFEAQEEDTYVTIRLSKPVQIPVIDNIYTHQVIISLPKVDWNKIAVPLNAAGLIKEYRVDQSLPDRTNLILSVDKDAGVIGKKLLAGGVQQGATFTIALSKENAKVPAWLSEVTTENLSYSDAEKEQGILDTRALKYRGGVLEYTNIGEGFYLTGLGGVLTGLNVTSSSTQTTKTNLSPGLRGLVGYGGMGYGVQLDRTYFGLELLLGHQGLLGQNQYTQGSNVASLQTRTGFSWMVAGRAGYNISPVSLLYAKLGVATSKVKIDGHGGDGRFLYNGKKELHRAGFLLGAGLEAAINDQLTGRIETYQTTYQPFKASSPSGTSGKFHPRVQEMLVGVSWKPSPMGGPATTDYYEDSVASGIYVGGEGGLASADNRREVTGTQGNNYKSTTTVIEPVWGLYGGYAHNIGRFYVAGEGQVAFNQTKFNESRSINNAPAESFENFLRWSFAATGRFGYIFNHGVIGYARAGVVASRFSHTGTNNGVPSILSAPKKSAGKTLGGVRIGGGLEIFIDPQLSVRGDYTMDLYALPIHISGNDSSKEKVFATRNEFKLGLAYTIPVHK
jgi:opacity protein-like surface antigen